MQGIFAVEVWVYKSFDDYADDKPFRHYVVDYNDKHQQIVLARQSRLAMAVGQVIVTHGIGESK